MQRKSGRSDPRPSCRGAPTIREDRSDDCGRRASKANGGLVGPITHITVPEPDLRTVIEPLKAGRREPGTQHGREDTDLKIESSTSEQGRAFDGGTRADQRPASCRGSGAGSSPVPRQAASQAIIEFKIDIRKGTTRACNWLPPAPRQHTAGSDSPQQSFGAPAGGIAGVRALDGSATNRSWRASSSARHIATTFCRPSCGGLEPLEGPQEESRLASFVPAIVSPRSTRLCYCPCSKCVGVREHRFRARGNRRRFLSTSSIAFGPRRQREAVRFRAP